MNLNPEIQDRNLMQNNTDKRECKRMNEINTISKLGQSTHTYT